MEKEHTVNHTQLKELSYRIFKDKGGGEIKLYRLGIYENECFELVELEENRLYPLHIHQDSSGIFYMIKGEGVILIHKENKEYKGGDVFVIPKETPHGFHTHTTTLFLSRQKPPIINDQNEVDIFYEET